MSAWNFGRDCIGGGDVTGTMGPLDVETVPSLGSDVAVRAICMCTIHMDLPKCEVAICHWWGESFARTPCEVGSDLCTTGNKCTEWRTVWRKCELLDVGMMCLYVLVFDVGREGRFVLTSAASV